MNAEMEHDLLNLYLSRIHGYDIVLSEIHKA